MRLNGKVALITGASRGIGSGIALKFAEKVADVVVNYRENIEMAETLTDKIRSLGGKALTVKADVSKISNKYLSTFPSPFPPTRLCNQPHPSKVRFAQ
jgi:NAD(P)-dependent dehydrogenase (short-subunit alcohol dehydrogenase family)